MANKTEFDSKIPTGFHYPKNLKLYDCDHLTTASFMQPSPVLIREVTPKMDLAIDMLSFCRLNPLVKPAFGRARINNRAFFVPFRTIFPKFAQFIESEPIYSMVDSAYGLQTSVPLIKNSDLVRIVVANSIASTQADYDVAFYDGSNNLTYVKLGALGHFAHRLLLGLGYKWQWTMYYASGVAEPTYSALPLLAMLKIGIDWYYPSQYMNSSDIQSVMPYLESDSLSARVVPYTVIYNAIKILQYCAYDDTVETLAWDRPTAPNNGCESPISIHDITMPYNLTTEMGDPIIGIGASNASGNQTPVGEVSVDLGGGSVGKNYGTITQYQHDLLKALTDMTQRHRLSGVRAVDRFLSEYGINLSSEIMKRSVLLGSSSYDIDFYDVMSNSDTSGAQLGQYAGKGLGFGKHMFEYSIGDEFGYVIIVQSIIPNAKYYQGLNKICLHKSIMDFYHGDFDGLGTRPIPSACVYMPESDPSDSSFVDANYMKQGFGFAPSDYELKSAPSVQSGLFALAGNVDVKKFSLNRDLSGMYFDASDVMHDMAFTRGEDALNYNRIFYNDGGAKGNYVENFILINHFEIAQEDYTAPLMQTYDFKKSVEAIKISSQNAKVN